MLNKNNPLWNVLSDFPMYSTMSTEFLRLRTCVPSFVTHSFTNTFMSLSLSNYISLTLHDHPITLILAQTNNTFHWVSKWWKLVMEGRLILSPVIYGGIMEKVCSYRGQLLWWPHTHLLQLGLLSCSLEDYKLIPTTKPCTRDLICD